MKYLLVSMPRKDIHLSSDAHRTGTEAFPVYTALCGRVDNRREYTIKDDTPLRRAMFIQGGRRICKACNKIDKMTQPEPGAGEG